MVYTFISHIKSCKSEVKRKLGRNGKLIKIYQTAFIVKASVMSFYQQKICQPGSQHNPKSENTLILRIKPVNSSYTLIFVVVKA